MLEIAGGILIAALVLAFLSQLLVAAAYGFAFITVIVGVILAWVVVSNPQCWPLLLVAVFLMWNYWPEKKNFQLVQSEPETKENKS